ncbi:MAG: phosphoribosylformylglycinamidine cyclo-ligase, partial [Burkholderiales bacterium]|nr:phosphoribosylformylglycinamidine cyclo-ligase [Burkholderiales bacterium]
LPVKGMAHITGGGLLENIPRVVPDQLCAVLDKRSWSGIRPPLFDWLQREGNIDEHEMHRVFNCGIGMVVIVAPEHEARALQCLWNAGETAARIGSIAAREPNQARTVLTC